MSAWRTIITSTALTRGPLGTLAGLKVHRRELIDPKISEYGGRIVKTTGDGLLLQFPIVVDAARRGPHLTVVQNSPDFKTNA